MTGDKLMFSPSSIMLIAGLALIVVGILGGGIEVKEIKIPQLSVFPRAASFLIGCVLTAWVLFDQNSQTDRRDDLGTAITNHSTDVREVKSDLKQLGIYAGPINNKPDPGYFQAVASFQQSRNIGQDGLVDGVTLAKLQEAVADLPARQHDTAAGPSPTPRPAPSASPQTSSPPVKTAEAPPRELPTDQPTVSEAKVQSTPLCRIQANHKARPSPGVNCTATGAPDELEICGTTNLCDLDWQLYSVYQVVKTSLDKDQQSKLAKDESAWVKKRGECRSDANCIALAYRSRIDQLR